MSQINGMLLFSGVALLSALLCLGIWLVRSRRDSGPSAQDERYNKFMLRNILPSNQGVPIDEVMANLKSEDMSGFHLIGPEDEGGPVSQ